MNTPLKATVLQAHLPEKLSLARALIARGYSLVLHAEHLTQELVDFSQLQEVQLRFGRVDFINTPTIATSYLTLERN